MKPNLTDEQWKWATETWNKSVSDGHSQAESVEVYLEGLMRPFVDAKAAEIVNSWKPVDAPEVLKRREELAEILKTVSVETLAAVEAAIAVDSKSDQAAVAPAQSEN